MPSSFKPWRAVIGNPDKSGLLNNYFNDLKSLETPGGDLARTYLLKAKDIGLKLVNDKIAKTENDVNTVMLTGFFHAYGPINNYLS